MSRMGYLRQQTRSAISSQQPDYFEDEESGILDSAILDGDIMSSPDSQLRRGSVASNGVITPAESHAWPQPYAGLSVEATTTAAHYPHHEEHNGFVRPHPPHVQTFIGQPHSQQWPYDHTSGHCTPTTAGAFISPHEAAPFYHDSQSHAYPHHGIDSARGSFSQHEPHPHGLHQQFHPLPGPPEQQFIKAPQVQTPMSPHSHQDWKAMGQAELEGRPGAKRMRPTSNSPRTNVDLQRSSGVRKKNARIEIPNERNIQNIDERLEHERDEELIKELKQQKRLLRNREAALASRQRKKKHTEDLEVREKDYTQHMHSLEGQISNMKIAMQNNDHYQQGLRAEIANLQRQNAALQEEHRDTMVRHTEETSVLRKRIQLLTEQVEAGPAPAPAMSAAPSSIGYADFNADMEALNVTGGWEDFIQMNDFHTGSPEDYPFGLKPEPILPSPVVSKTQITTTVAKAPKQTATTESTSEPPVASGLLFFLLLCGAFVASKPAISRPGDMPEVPDDVRAAAPAVLENLLQEGAPLPTQTSLRSTHHASLEPANSALAHTNPRKRGRLDQVHYRITSPTKQQEADQAFSLSTAQYASIADADYISDDHASSSRHSAGSRTRPNLAEALARSREEYIQSSKAEVYTRSLLWDRIPAETVQQFKDMVKDHSDIEQRRQLMSEHETNDEMLAYNMKTEV